jgi:hypothetical protein
MKRMIFLSSSCAGLLCLGAVAEANLIANPGFSAGGSSWSTNVRTEIGPWGESDGNCAYVPNMSAGSGQIWQYIPSWKLPSTNVSMYYWDARKRSYNQSTTATIHIYGLKSSTAVTGGALPGGTEGTDYSLVAGAPNLVMGNGFWWSSVGYKWTISNATRSNYPHGLLLSVSWAGGTNGAGFDNFVLQSAGAQGQMAGDPIIGTPTGVPGQTSATVTMAYSGLGINYPIWIDPEWAIGYEYEITTNTMWNSFKAIELVPVGDGLFDIDIWDTATSGWLEVATDVPAGQVSFGTIAPGHWVQKFRVRGIEPEAELDPDGHGFPIGLMFTNGGLTHTITTTAIVPEPATLLLVGLPALLLLGRRNGRRFS